MRTYKPKPPREDRVCPCGATFTPAPKGPIPSRCRGCRAAFGLTVMAAGIVEHEVPTGSMVKAAKVLDAASKRLKRKAGVL